MARRRKLSPQYVPAMYPQACAPAIAGVQEVHDGNYDSIQDFVDAATKELRNPRNSGHVHDCLDDTHSVSWFGADCRTGREVVKKIHDGWPEGQARLETLTAELVEVNVHPKDRRRRRVRCDFGDSVDIHAIYAGRIGEAWEVAKRKEGCGPQRVDILVNMLCAGAEQNDVLFWRGAAAIVLADKLEQAGYMVRLVVGFGGMNSNGDKTSCRITVKAHDKPLDITSTASVIMPGFFRGIGHCWLASHAGTALGSYGISVQQGRIEDGELVLSHDVRDEKTAREWLTRTVGDFNDGVMLAA